MPKKAASKRAPPKFVEDDDILDSDSEVDEFTDYVASTRRPANGESDDDEEGSEEGDFTGDEGAFESASEDEGDGVGMYEADEWDAGADSDSGSGSGSESEDDNAAKMRKLRKGLNDIPLDTLMRVQAKMGIPAAQGASGREAKLAAAKAKLAEMQRAKGKAMAVDEDAGPSKRRKRFESESESEEDIKRSNKHAPVAMSSKKQVSRRRSVIDVPRKEVRDPRFSSISAEKANSDVHAKRYDFVPELLQAEMKDLQAQVLAAKKAEKACKLYEKPRFTEAREEIERELARVRTRLDRAKTEQREREVMARVKAEENEKRKAGKGAWYMKKGEKKDLLLKARFEALEKTGGKRAVKKVVDKKLKKVAGKEKKSRPFAAGGFSGGGGGAEGGGKRRRVA